MPSVFWIVQQVSRQTVSHKKKRHRKSQMGVHYVAKRSKQEYGAEKTCDIYSEVRLGDH